MQLYAVNFIPLLGSLYMFRVFYTPIIRSTVGYFIEYIMMHGTINIKLTKTLVKC